MRQSRFNSIFNNADIALMQQCLAHCAEAVSLGEVPVAAALVDADGRLLSMAHNRVITDKDPTAHAEVLALREAATKVSNYRLDQCTLYSTLEPCVMCFGALIQARVKRLVYAAAEPRSGACGSLCALHQLEGFNHRIEISRGLYEEEAQKMLSHFFKQRREEKQ